MSSSDRRYTIAFNGEVYNFEELRNELVAKGEAFQSHSDTEVVLRLYQRKGSECLARLEGMFAFAIWDEHERTCFLARDPLGIKPLYYQAKDGALCFASELQALLSSRLVGKELSAEGVRSYLMTGSVPEPVTLINGVKMLPAGHHLLWRDSGTTLTKYWEVGFGKQRPEVGGRRTDSADVGDVGPTRVAGKKRQ
jgi:asparagine synthase (glutamine-hydrolysing)